MPVRLSGKGSRDLTCIAGGDVDVVRPKDPADVGLVVSGCPEAPDGRLLEAKCFEKLEGKLLPIEALFRQFRNGLFNFYGVDWSFQGLITRIPQPSKSLTLRVARAASVARAMAAI